MKLLAVVKNPISIARYLTAAGEPIEAPGRSPGRGPPYWKSRVLRLQARGDESEREAWPRATARTRAARASAQPGLGPRGSVGAEAKTRVAPRGGGASGAATVWRAGRLRGERRRRAYGRPERADRAPGHDVGARTGWQTALVSLTLRQVAPRSTSRLFPRLGSSSRSRQTARVRRGGPETAAISTSSRPTDRASGGPAWRKASPADSCGPSASRRCRKTSSVWTPCPTGSASSLSSTRAWA